MDLRQTRETETEMVSSQEAGTLARAAALFPARKPGNRIYANTIRGRGVEGREGETADAVTATGSATLQTESEAPSSIR
jgi:hypothetical protein